MSRSPAAPSTPSTTATKGIPSVSTLMMTPDVDEDDGFCASVLPVKKNLSPMSNEKPDRVTPVAIVGSHPFQKRFTPFAKMSRSV
jgi:hypothetical protein